jgi:methylenetetrahydrofolate dehydrogenase (NADP+)/methenyltetrahydrofolate cyclohydrolase
MENTITETEKKPMTEIIDGKKISAEIREEIRIETQGLYKKTKKSPGLAVILVGKNTASQSYVRGKKNACEKAGFKSFSYDFPDGISEAELLKLIKKLNKDKKVDGILVQLPLPENINEEKIINAIAFEKDVDGFHPENVGKLWTNQDDGFFPCTPFGVIELLKRYKIETSGKKVVIIGRSNIVGKPLAGLFLRNEINSTVTVCHSRTKNLSNVAKTADILVSAIGVAGFVTPEMVKEGAVVIDVGINRVSSDCAKGYEICGDVDFKPVAEKASYITPVPGGVGPMTITMLLKNTLISFKRRVKLKI